MRTIVLLLLLAAPAYGQCQSGAWIGHVDYLNWHARSQAWKASYYDYGEARTFNRDFSPTPGAGSGVRAGLGRRFYDDWEVTWNYTYFGANDTGDSVGQFDHTVRGPRSNPDTLFTWHSALDFNLHDLEIGKRLPLTETFDARLFGGPRFAMLNIDRWDVDPRLPDEPLSEVGDTNAYGIRFGAESRWRVYNFSLFTKAAVSPLIATTQHSTSVRGIVWYKDYTDGVLVVETAAGISWQYKCIEVAGGYEIAFWENAMPSIDVSEAGEITSADLLLDGFFVRAAFTF